MALERAIVLVACAAVAASEGVFHRGPRCEEKLVESGCAEPCRTPQDPGLTKCECDVGGKGATAARFCLGGQLMLAWYDVKTAEQCEANMSAYTAIFPAAYSGVWREREGERCVKDAEMRSHLRTCQGVPDFSGHAWRTFNSPDCNSSTLAWSASDQMGGCRCLRAPDGGVKRSECSSCDASEAACSTSDACFRTKSLADSAPLCAVSGDACVCASLRHVTDAVCFSGMPSRLYFSGVAASSRCSRNQSPSLVVPLLADGQCWPEGPGSVRWLDCAGVADGGAPVERHFLARNCVPLSEQSNATRPPRKVCECMGATDRVESGCRSCSGDGDCQASQALCSSSPGGRCIWSANAPVGEQCSCASRNYKSGRHCWGGKVADLYFKDVDRSRCLAPGADDLAYMRLRAPFDPDLVCTPGGDGNPGATHSIRAECTGVVDGGRPKQRYFSDDRCREELVELAEDSSAVYDETCECQGPLGCEKGTTFETYACDSEGKVVAREFSDSLCTERTGAADRTLSTFTGDSLGACLPWPPRVLAPGRTGRVALTCPLAGKPPFYRSWGRSSDCSDSGPAPDSQGHISGCFCRNEFQHDGQIADQLSTVAGDVTLTMDNTTLDLQDTGLITAVAAAIAELAGVALERVMDVQLSYGRRLGQLGRRLEQVEVIAAYRLVLPKAIAATVVSELSSVGHERLDAALQASARDAGLAQTPEVMAVGEASAAPTKSTDSKQAREEAQAVDSRGVGQPGQRVVTSLSAALCVHILASCLAVAAFVAE